jgi:hypothetical protein
MGLSRFLSVRRRKLDAVDDEEIHRARGLLESQPELLAQRREDRRAIGIDRWQIVAAWTGSTMV